jgi:group I intron endonuclease
MPEIYEGNTGVYCWRNIRNGKRYVGSAARGFKARWWVHIAELKTGRHHSRHLQHAWDKYGSRSFVFQILERCPPERCLEREQWWLDHFDAADPEKGYNMSPTVSSRLGMKSSAETVAKHKKYWEDPEHRLQVSESLKRTLDNPEHTRRKSEHAKRMAVDPEVRRKKSETMKRLWADPEYRQTMRCRHAEPEYKQATIERNRKLTSTPEWRCKMLEGVRRRDNDPEYRRKQTEANARRRGKPLSGEHLRKVREARTRQCGKPLSAEHRQKLREARYRVLARKRAAEANQDEHT